MRITIINETNTVGANGEFRDNLNLSQCGLPEKFRAFQWNQYGDSTGEIEYNSPMIQNDRVTEIPVWVNACITVLETQLEQERIAAEAKAEADRIAAEQAAQNESQP